MLWRSVVNKNRCYLVPRLASAISGRFYATDHNPPPLCSASASAGKECGKFNSCGDPRFEKEPPPKNLGDTFEFHHLVKQPPECCTDPCQDRYPLFDDCFYKMSDKAKRIYQITWVECPPIQIKPKKICCYMNAKHPPIRRRKRKAFVGPDGVACPQECVGPREGPCPKITMPGCRPIDPNTTCFIIQRKKDCKKVKAPYPAYSECTRDAVRPPRRVECNCLDIPSPCEINAELSRRESNPGTKQCGGSHA